MISICMLENIYFENNFFLKYFHVQNELFDKSFRCVNNSCITSLERCMRRRGLITQRQKQKGK